MNRSPNIFLMYGALVTTLLVALTFFSFNMRQEAAVIYEGPPPAPIVAPNPFDTITISAEGAAVYDINKKVFIYTKEAGIAMPLASVTKLMTAYAAGQFLSSTSTITVAIEDLAPEGDSGFFAGQRWSYPALRDVMLVASSNDAAAAIARNATTSFITYMNTLAVERGWHSFRFDSPHGLDRYTSMATAMGSAEDVARLFTAMLREMPEALEKTREPYLTATSANYIPQTFRNTNVSVNEIPSVLGSKTGYTVSAGGNLAMAWSVGLSRPMIIVILGSADQDQRFRDAEILMRTTVEYLESRSI